MEIPPEDWHTSFVFTYKSLISCYAQENNFKLLFWQYRDPGSINLIFPDSSDSFLIHLLALSQNKRNLFAHLVGMRSYLSFCGSKFFKYITEDRTFIYPAMVCQVAEIQSLRFFSSAACRLISRFWRTNITPPINLWADLINYVMLMEEMQARELDTWENVTNCGMFDSLLKLKYIL